MWLLIVTFLTYWPDDSSWRTTSTAEGQFETKGACEAARYRRAHGDIDRSNEKTMCLDVKALFEKR